MEAGRQGCSEGGRQGGRNGGREEGRKTGREGGCILAFVTLGASIVSQLFMILITVPITHTQLRQSMQCG